MAINLQKGQSVGLDKNQYDLSEITIGLGWDVRVINNSLTQKKSSEDILNKFKSFIGLGEGSFNRKYLYATKRDSKDKSPEETKPYDLDAIAFLLGDDNKIKNLGKRGPLESGLIVDFLDSDIIFYNNPKHRDSTIFHTGDNRTGEGEGDDEQIIVKLNNLNPKYNKIVFFATIYQGQRKGQHFGLIKNAFIRAMDAQGKEILKFDLSIEKAFDKKCSLIFAEVTRTEHNQWQFQAVGNALPTDRFGEVLKEYM